HALVKPLRQRHRPLRRVPQPIVRSLLQLRRGEGRRRIPLLFLLCDRRHLPFRAAHRRHNLVRRFLVRYLYFLALALAQLRFEDRRLARVQHGCGTNARISCSRSAINRSATVCTRPAESPRRTLFHSSGDTLYPTIRSSTRRACCASTRFPSTCRGFSNAARIAFGVISLNVTRKIFFGSIGGMFTSSRSFLPLAFLDFASSFSSAAFSSASLPLCPFEETSSSVNFAGFDSTIARCCEIASPSRSGSPAR